MVAKAQQEVARQRIAPGFGVAESVDSIGLPGVETKNNETGFSLIIVGLEYC